MLAGRYRVDRRIGVGGTAAVFLADDEVLGREVAVKRVHTDGTADDMRRLRREARLGASLSHPNLVMVYDTITAEDGAFIVMEHIDGRPLSELIGERGMPADEALPILWAVADALDYAHRHGVVHRDVKPANVLIGNDGQVKLVDLGAAIGAGVTRVTQAHEVVGTLSYLAPERLSGESVGEPAGDVYSLAVLAFETLTGSSPWPVASPQEQLGRALRGAPDVAAAWPEASPGLAEALERGMDPDPAARYATAGALVGDIEAGLAPPAEPTQEIAPPPTPSYAVGDPPSRSATNRSWTRRLAPGALAACALVAAAIVFAATRGGEESPTSPAAQAPASADGSARPGGHSGRQDAGSDVTPSSSTTATTTESAPSNTTAAPADSGTALNDQGYALLQRGSYDEAIPVLKQAVDELRSDPSSLTYAYALFNLGRALRLAGQPEEAVPILEQRLRIPNQTATVQAELDAARAAAEKTRQPPGEAKPPKGEPPHGRALGHEKHGGVPPAEGDEGG